MQWALSIFFFFFFWKNGFNKWHESIYHIQLLHWNQFHYPHQLLMHPLHNLCHYMQSPVSKNRASDKSRLVYPEHNPMDLYVVITLVFVLVILEVCLSHLFAQNIFWNSILKENVWLKKRKNYRFKCNIILL